MKEKKISLRLLLSNTIMDINIDARMVLSQLSKNLMDGYTLISLIDEIFKHIQEDRLDRFIFKLITDKELGTDETIPNADMTQLNTLYEIVNVFWVNVTEDSSREHILDLVGVTLNTWKENLKIRKIQDNDEATDSLRNSLSDDILFIMMVYIYNMHVAMILAREESTRNITENNLKP